MEMKKKTKKTKIRNVQWVNEQGINGGETAMKGVRGCWGHVDQEILYGCEERRMGEFLSVFSEKIQLRD